MMMPKFLFATLIGASVVACGAVVTVPTEQGTPTANSNESTSAPGTSSTSATSNPTAGPVCAGPGVGSPEAGPVCAPAQHISSAAEFVNEAAKLDWQSVALDKSSILRIGADLVVNVDIEIDASALRWKGAPDDRGIHAPLFREYAFPLWDSGRRLAGVRCVQLGDRPPRKGVACARIAITKGTTFRLRAVVEDMHPMSPTYWPFIEFERSCAAPCAPDERRCAATQTCFGVGYDTCAFCAGSAPAICACRDACGTKANDASCAYDKSPDQLELGKCKAGTCVVKPR
jgi:hypothetical protein